VYSLACPLLVPLIEEGWHNKPEAKMILKKYLKRIKSCNIDVLILGCTHYPLMIGDFKRYMGKGIKILPSGEITALKLKDYLDRHPEIEKKLSKHGKRKFVTTDDPVVFQKFVQSHLGMKIGKPEKIKLG
jgi:glutamate racemase